MTTQNDKAIEELEKVKKWIRANNEQIYMVYIPDLEAELNLRIQQLKQEGK